MKENEEKIADIYNSIPYKNDDNVKYQWFKDYGFNLKEPLFIFDDNFRAYGIEYSLIQKRAHFIINSVDDKVVAFFSSSNLTFVGERFHFTFDFIKKINSLDTPVSIITANDAASLEHFLKNSLQNMNLSINTPYLQDFLPAVEEDRMQALELIEKVKESDALLFNTHGDILCTNLKHAILCARDQSTKLEKNSKLPACAISEQCFRKARFKNRDLFQLIHFNELKAKVIFLNTCGGISFTGTKFGEYPNLLPLKAIEYNTIIYISSYLIKNSTIEEIFLFWGLLKKYKNFSQAIFCLNNVSRAFLEKEKVFVMLGDGIVNLKNDDKSCSYEIIHSDQNAMIIRIAGIKSSSLFFSFNMNDHELLTFYSLNKISVFINEPYNCTVGCFMDTDKNIVHLIIQFHGNYPESVKVHLYPKSIIQSVITMTEKKIELFLSIYKAITIDKTYKDDLQLLSSEILKLFKLLKLTMNQSDLNGTKYLYLHSISHELNNKIFDFEELLLESIINTSLNSDTHLVLNETMLLRQKNILPDISDCYICENGLYKMGHIFKENSSITFLQRICPQCEIISVQSNQIGIVRIFSPVTIKRGSTVNVRIEYQPGQENKSTVKIGIVLINGSVSIIKNDLSFRKKLIYKTTIKIPKRITPGLYYWRCILLYDGNISISHRQVHLC